MTDHETSQRTRSASDLSASCVQKESRLRTQEGKNQQRDHCVSQCALISVLIGVSTSEDLSSSGPCIWQQSAER